jgi:hypothetical protein
MCRRDTVVKGLTGVAYKFCLKYTNDSESYVIEFVVCIDS